MIKRIPVYAYTFSSTRLPLNGTVKPRLHLPGRLTCDDRTMPFFAFSCGLRRVTLQCPYDSTVSYGFLRLPTASYDLRSLYDFVVVCTFTNFKNRKTVARRHVVGSIIVRAPYGNPAMIVRSPHDFMIIGGRK